MERSLAEGALSTTTYIARDGALGSMQNQDVQCCVGTFEMVWCTRCGASVDVLVGVRRRRNMKVCDLQAGGRGRSQMSHRAFRRTTMTVRRGLRGVSWHCMGFHGVVRHASSVPWHHRAEGGWGRAPTRRTRLCHSAHCRIAMPPPTCHEPAVSRLHHLELGAHGGPHDGRCEGVASTTSELAASPTRALPWTTQVAVWCSVGGFLAPEARQRAKNR